MSDKGQEEEKQNSALENAGLAGAAAETVQRHGSAAKEHLVALGGVDNEAGKNLTRSLESVAGSKINPAHEQANINQQAGYSAEILDVARTNADNIINGQQTRKVRSDDMGNVNDPLFDHWEVDKNGNLIPGSGTQMKFVGSDPKEAFAKLMSKKFQKYIDNDVPFEVPSDYFEKIKEEAAKEIKKLEEQVTALKAKGMNEAAQKKLEKIEKIKKIKNNLRKSKVSTQDAINARLSPRLSTAKDIAKISHKAGVSAAKTGAAIGGGISLIRNVIAVVKDDKKTEDALVDVLTDTGKAAAISYGTAFIGSALKAAMQNAPRQLTRSLAKTNLPGIVVTTILETGMTLSKYIGGDINGSQCLEELGEKGTGMLSSAALAGQGALIGTFLIPIPGVGTVAGGLIGGMVGYALASEYYKQIMAVLDEANQAHEIRLQIEAECTQAIHAIREYRNELEKLIHGYLAEYKESFNIALNEMSEAFERGDADTFIAGANNINRKLGGRPQFQTTEEFRALLLQRTPLKLTS